MDRVLRLTLNLLGSSALCIVWLGYAGPTASACFRVAKSPSSVLPLDGSVLPANMLQWVATTSSGSSYQVRIVDLGGGTRVAQLETNDIDALEGPWLRPNMHGFRVTERVGVGSELHFVRLAQPDSPNEALHEELTLARYTIAHEASVPETLGVIQAEPEIGTLSIGGPNISECTRELRDASFDRVRLQLAAEAEPLEPMIRYELRLDDDRAWSFDDGQLNETRMGTSSLGPGEDLVFLACHGEVKTEPTAFEMSAPPEIAKKMAEMRQSLEPGKHRVRMLGRLPDGTVLESNELVLDLNCSHVAAEERVPEHAADSGAASSGGSDTAGSDAAVQQSDEDITTHAEQKARAQQASCSATLGTQHTNQLALAFGLVLLALARVRSRPAKAKSGPRR